MKLSFLIVVLFVCRGISAQSNSEVYYNQFDDLVGTYDSDLNTGKRFEDLYMTISQDEFRFFVGSEDNIGYVKYNSQSFFQSSLRYDVLEDNLLFKNVGSPNVYEVILEPMLVDSFSFNNRNFVKLPIKASKFPFYKNGYFESLAHIGSFHLYKKHEKIARKKLGDKIIYYTFSKREIMVFKYKDDFYEGVSKNDIIAILPHEKEKIRSFYKTYKDLESKNKIEFLKRLFTLLNTDND